jgi:hypothetical protein
LKVASEDSRDSVFDEAALAFPQYLEYKSTLYRAQAKKYPPNPKTLGEVEIEGEWSQTALKERFLLDHTKDNDFHMLTFASDQALDTLCEAKTIGADGTFSSRPTLFDQHYLLHSKIEGAFVPSVFVLMNSKTEEAYVKMFEKSSRDREKLNMMRKTQQSLSTRLSLRRSKSTYQSIGVKFVG